MLKKLCDNCCALFRGIRIRFLSACYRKRVLLLRLLYVMRREGVGGVGSVLRMMVFHPCRVFRVLRGRELHVGTIELPLTGVCTLRCKGCSALVDYYPPEFARHMDLDMVVSQIKGLIAGTDSIYKLRLLGGEPLCYPFLYDVLRVISDEERIMFCEIVTNGTLTIKDESILKILKNKKFHIVISDYGALSRKRNELKCQLDEHGVRYVKYHIERWYDFGDLSLRNFSARRLKEMYYYCPGNRRCVSVLDGKLYHCFRHSHGSHIGMIPSNDGDYVNLLDENVSRKDMKRRLFRFFYGYTPYVTACNYCSYSQHPEYIDIARQV